MKKFLALLLAVSMCFAFCACGGDSESNENDTTAAEITENNNEIIEFTDVVLHDDNNLKIELVNFYATDVNWAAGKQNEKCVTFKTTNKTDHELVVNTNKFYLNDEEAYVCMKDGSMAPDPGKSGKYSFYIGNQGTPEHVALDSLEDIYDLEGSFSVLSVYDDSSKNTSYDVDFSIKDALNPEAQKDNAEAEETATYKLEDTVSTDMVEFKITRNEFANKVAFGTYDSYYRPTTENRGLTAGENKTFLAFTFEIKNISTERFAESDICGGNRGNNFTVIYDGKYEFTEGDYADAVLLKDSALAFVDPLETREMRALIKCAGEVATEEDKPVYLDIVLPSSNGEETFRYVVR